jgi:Holliday junction resolvase
MIFGRTSMGRFSKDKGKRGERELAGELTRVLGITARRGVQFQGSPDSPDVITNLPDIHIECKRTERFQLYKALEQAIADAGGKKIPVVCHRQNNQPWVVAIRLNDLPQFITALLQKDNNERTDFTRGNF